MFRPLLESKNSSSKLAKHLVNQHWFKSNFSQTSHLNITDRSLQTNLGLVVGQQQRRKMSSSNKHIFENVADKELELDRVLKSSWTKCVGREAISKSFKFEDFNQAFSFMTAIAMQAEKMDHHPEWFNVYNKVDITLASHFCNGISKLDIACADYIDKIYASRYSK